MATLLEIKQLLNKYNILDSENADQMLEFLAQYNTANLEKYIANCVFLKQKLNDACTTVTLQQVYYIIATSNRKLLQNMQTEYDSLVKETSLDQETAKSVFKTLSKGVLDTTNKTDKEIAAIAERFISDLTKAKEISSSFKANVDEDISTKLYTNCIKRMQTFYTSTNPTQLKNLLYYLLNNIEGLKKPSTADLLYISERCASFYSNATAEKVENISNVLTDFANFIYNKFDDLRTNDNNIQIMQYQSELKAKNLRNILLTTPTIFTENPATISFNIDLIKGNKSLGELLKQHNFTVQSPNLDRFKNIVLDFSPIDMQKLYTSNLSALSTSPNVLLTTLQFIDTTATKVFGNEIPPEEYLSADTYAQIQLIHRLADSTNISELEQWQNNLELLSNVISKDKLKKYFLSNFKLATVPTEFVKKQVADTILSSKTSQELETKFDRLISKNFFWDVSNKDGQKSNKTTSTIEVPKYRVGNKKAEPLAFGLDLETAQKFLASIGYNQEVINVWASSQTQEDGEEDKKKNKTNTLDVATINHCNEILNLIRNLNSLLDTKPSIPALYRVGQDLNELYIEINNLSVNTRNMNTSTKGLIVNVKNSFNDLSARYNTVISKIQVSSREEYKKLSRQYNKLREEIDSQYELHQKYKNNVPAIIQDQSELIKEQTKIVQNINDLQQLQEKNRIERFERINQFSSQVQEYFDTICKQVEHSLNQQLLSCNPAEHISMFEEIILEENKKHLFKELGISETSRFTGEIFLTLKKLQGVPKYTALYSQIKNQLQENGINLDIQLAHSQPENFHGDMLSPQLISNFLGDNYTPENYETIYNYNGILNSAWHQYNVLNSKIEAEEAKLTAIKERIAELKSIINSGFGKKQQGISSEEELTKLQQEKDNLQQRIDELKNMHFNR